MGTLAGLRSEMILRIPKLRRACGAEVRLENGEESFTMVVTWRGGEHRRRFWANEAAACYDAEAVKACACRCKDEIIAAVLRRRLPSGQKP